MCAGFRLCKGGRDTRSVRPRWRSLAAEGLAQGRGCGPFRFRTRVWLQPFAVPARSAFAAPVPAAYAEFATPEFAPALPERQRPLSKSKPSPTEVWTQDQTVFAATLGEH